MSDAIIFEFTFWNLFWLIISSAGLLVLRAWIKAHYGVQVKGWTDVFNFIFGEGADNVVKVVPIVKEALSADPSMIPVPVPSSDPNLTQLVKNTMKITETLDEILSRIGDLEDRINALEADTTLIDNLNRANGFIASRGLVDVFNKFEISE